MSRPYMPLFKSITSFRSLTVLHAHLIVTGFQNSSLASTKLIESYAQLGSLKTSKLIFDYFPKPDSYLWGVIIKCYVRSGSFREALCMYQSILASGEVMNGVNGFIFSPVLRACSAINDLVAGKKVHSRVVKSGFESDHVVETSVMGMYGEMGLLRDARKVFDEMRVKDVVSWSSIVSVYVRNGEPGEGLEVFREMVSVGVEVDAVTMLSVVEACGELGLRGVGKSVHGYVVSRGLGSGYETLRCSLVVMYGKLGCLGSAERVFRGGVCQSVVPWTAMISCYDQNGYYLEALQTFSEMLGCKVEPNSVTLMKVVCSCARLRYLREGKSVHGYAVRNNVDHDDNFLRSSLIELYANCGDLRSSRMVFDKAQKSDTVSWNNLISGCARENMVEDALTLFNQMLLQGISPDSYTLAIILSACGTACLSEMGSQIHCFLIKVCLPNEFVNNTLIDMYAKCGFIKSAFQIFQGIHQKSLVTWNSMICGFSHNGYSNEALKLFYVMYARYLDMDAVTFLSVIQACSNIGLVDKGKWIHHKLITFGVRKDMYIDTALMNMYSRCGDLQIAERIFYEMSKRSVVSWSAMMGNYAMHGQFDDSIYLFHRMVESGVKPNDVCFMNILSACSHAGYVEKGKSYFSSMVRDFGIMPSSEHYACLVDMLSRAGDLTGAYEVINSMPFPAHSSIWGALVNGCKIHQRMDFLESINRDLSNLHTDDSGYFKLLSNVYAEGGKWNDSMAVKSNVRSGIKKVCGYSMVEV